MSTRVMRNRPRRTPITRAPYEGHRPFDQRHRNRPAVALGADPATGRWQTAARVEAKRPAPATLVTAIRAGWQSGRQARLARKAAARRYAAQRRSDEAAAREFAEAKSVRGKFA